MDKRFNEQREEMKALLKRYKDVIVERASEFKRNSEGKKLSTKRLMSALVATVLASVGGVSTIVSNFNDVRESIKNMEDEQIEEMYESTPEEAVVKYVYTTLYSQLPDRNTLDELSSGRIIKYTKGNEKNWKQNENKSINFLRVDEVIAPEQLIEGENEDAAVENINNTMEYNKSELYILKENIEEYVECTVLVDELKFRKSPDPDLENSPRFANEGTLYVYKDSEGIGEYQYKKAILVDKDGRIDYGYVADTEGRLEEKSSGACIGMVKQGTFVRSSAMLPEYEESVIAGTLYNGDVIEVTGKANNYYYECKIEGDDNTYYIRNNTVILDSQFDYDITVEGSTVMHGFNNDGSITTRKNGEGEDIEVAKGDGMVVDLSTSKDGLYAVWDKDKQAVGYLYGDDIYVSKLGKSVAEMLDPKSINKKNMEEAQKSREHKEISMDSKDDKPTIVLDFKKISLDNMKKVINYCKENNIDLGGVIFSIGSTNSPLGSQTFRMPHMADGEGESEVQNAWDQMKELSKLELKGTNNGRANTAELLEIIELLIDNNIAVGLYYYSAPINETEVSCEAAYIYTIVKYLNENSEKYRNYTKKLPISIDVENGLQGSSFNVSRENEQNTRRAELTQKLIELLGRGIKDAEEQDKYFCIDNKSVKDGYNVVSEKGVIIYGDIRKGPGKLVSINNSPNGKVKSYYELIENLEKNYPVYNWASCQITKWQDENGNWIVGGIDHDYTDFTDEYSQLVNTRERYVEDKDLYDNAAFIQMLLDDYICGLPCDMSITSRQTLEKVLAGADLKDKFSDVMANAIANHQNAMENDMNPEEDEVMENKEDNDMVELGERD